MAVENLHLTLNFFGDVDEHDVPELCRDVKRAVESHDPFFISVSGLGAFPEVARPRVVWMGVTDGSAELMAIHADVAELMATWGFPKERKDYHPHLTLGRLRRGGRWNGRLLDSLDELRDRDLGGWSVSEVIIYSSHLDRQGPTYTPMSRINLLGHSI